jgi:hypothetical protein
MPRLAVRLKGRYMHDASRSKVHLRPCRLVYFWPNAAAPTLSAAAAPLRPYKTHHVPARLFINLGPSDGSDRIRTVRS